MTTTSLIHIKQTAAFIGENPVEITITRKQKVETASGGWRWADDRDLPSQTVRKVGRLVSSQANSVAERTASDGKAVVPTCNVIGLPDWDVQVGDTFVINNVTHEVVWISELPAWRKSAEVYEHAG